MTDVSDSSLPAGTSPPPAESSDRVTQGLPNYSVIQQQLIDSRDRLDREVTRLTRMQAFNGLALRMDIDAEFIQAVGDAIVDIFELEFGIFWLLDGDATPRKTVGMLGLRVDQAQLHEAGGRLIEMLARSHETESRIIDAEALAGLAAWLPARQAIVAPCRDAQGRLLGILLTGNTVRGAAFFESITPELGQAFGLFAQQLAALIENRRGRAIIVRQMAEIKRADQRLRLALDSNKAGLWDLDLASGTIELSSGWASLIGGAPRDSQTRFDIWFGQIPADDQIKVRALLEACQRGEQDSFELVHRIHRRDGSILWVLSRGYVPPESTATRHHILGATFDISRQQALEAELAREKGFLRTLVSTLPDLVWLKDGDGVYLACNPKFERLYGAPEDAIIGKTDFDFVDADTAELFRRHDRAAIAAGKPTINEEALTFATDGHTELVETIKSPMYDHQGALIGVLGVARDITQRRQAEEQIRKLSRAVEQSPSSIVITDLDATIEYVNDAFLKTTGYSREEVIGRNPRILRSGRTPQATHDSLWQTLSTGNIWHGEFQNRRKDGSDYVEFAIVAPIRLADGRITHYLAIKEDITEKKRNAEELDRHRHHLMDLVAERTLQLAEAKDIAEAANRAKSTFLTNMSHEIRTPMNAIIGLTHLLLRDRPTESQRERLKMLGSSANHLLAILNDILDLSKIESEKLIIKHSVFEIGEVLTKIDSLIAEKLHAKSLRFDVDLAVLPEQLVGDGMRLSQILLNYLNNAVKFSHAGIISLTATVIEDLPDSIRVRFVVKDTGIGIAAETLPRLFQTFEQADASNTRNYSGAGLGLAINKRLAELMGGEVGVDSAPEHGSSFWVTLPFGKVSTNPPAIAPSDPAPALEKILQRDYAECRLLLVEDDYINQEVALELLRNAAGLQTDLAVNGIEALAMATKTRYDLILMDQQMPGMDGLSATRAIRQLPSHAHTPILAMSAGAFEEDRQACIAAGMNDHLAKPVEPDRLFALLIDWLGRCRSPSR